jgi:hypothetical protein
MSPYTKSPLGDSSCDFFLPRYIYFQTQIEWEGRMEKKNLSARLPLKEIEYNNLKLGVVKRFGRDAQYTCAWKPC